MERSFCLGEKRIVFSAESARLGRKIFSSPPKSPANPRLFSSSQLFRGPEARKAPPSAPSATYLRQRSAGEKAVFRKWLSKRHRRGKNACARCRLAHTRTPVFIFGPMQQSRGTQFELPRSDFPLSIHLPPELFRGEPRAVLYEQRLLSNLACSHAAGLLRRRLRLRMRGVG